MDPSIPAVLTPCPPHPGPLLNPLVVFCPSEAELKQWLYHLEKQIQLCGGRLALPLLAQVGVTALSHCPSWIPFGGLSRGKRVQKELTRGV